MRLSKITAYSLIAFVSIVIWAVIGTAVAQQAEDAPILMVRVPTTTELSPTNVTGVVDVLMTQQTHAKLTAPWEVVGFVFDASVQSAEMIEMPLTYFMDFDGSVRRMCDVILYLAVIEEWEAEIQAYVMGEQNDTNCLGPIPVFYYSE